MYRAVSKIAKFVILSKYHKKELKKDINNFLETLNKLSSKKNGQINKVKQKSNLREIRSSEPIISSLNSLDKKELPVFIRVTIKLKLKVENIYIVMN